MAKTDTTLELEKRLYKNTNKMGVFSCFEVTIGFGGRERVDYLTYDTKGIWRCYEVKTSKSDFYSKAAKTFVGHYNYYVMPNDLYEDVKDDIPKHIGIHSGSNVIKNPQRQELGVDEQVLKDSLIRSLHRENEKFIKTSDNTLINKINSTNERLKRELRQSNNKHIEYRNIAYEICDRYNIDYKEVIKSIKDV